MGRSEQYGKPYTFFLDIAKFFVDDTLHQKMKVPREGRAMYQYLNEKLSTEYESYENVINNCLYLSPEQKEYLLPASEIINLDKLDFLMCVNIMRLLQTGKITKNYKETRLVIYMKKLRNNLCHPSMFRIEEDITKEQFNENVQEIIDHLGWLGIKKNWLVQCRQIFQT